MIGNNIGRIRGSSGKALRKLLSLRFGMAMLPSLDIVHQAIMSPPHGSNVLPEISLHGVVILVFQRLALCQRTFTGWADSR
jgi:hypothetical protein